MKQKEGQLGRIKPSPGGSGLSAAASSPWGRDCPLPPSSPPGVRLTWASSSLSWSCSSAGAWTAAPSAGSPPCPSPGSETCGQRQGLPCGGTTWVSERGPCCFPTDDLRHSWVVTRSCSGTYTGYIQSGYISRFQIPLLSTVWTLHLNHSINIIWSLNRYIARLMSFLY